MAEMRAVYLWWKAWQQCQMQDQTDGMLLHYLLLDLHLLYTPKRACSRLIDITIPTTTIIRLRNTVEMTVDLMCHTMLGPKSTVIDLDR
jgi:hypothetical protein